MLVGCRSKKPGTQLGGRPGRQWCRIKRPIQSLHESQAAVEEVLGGAQSSPQWLWLFWDRSRRKMSLPLPRNSSLDIRADHDVSAITNSIGTFLDEYGRERGYAFLAAMAACSIIGATGNSVALSVLVSRLRRMRSCASPQKAFKSHYNYFTCALAASDLFVCSVWIPYEVLIVLRLINNEALCKAMGFLSDATITFAAITHFGICVERYYAVCRPTSPVKARQMSAVIAALGAASTVMSVPAVFVSSVNAAASADAAIDAAEAAAAPSDGGLPALDEVSCHYEYKTGVGLYYNASLGAVLSTSIIVMLCLYAVVFRAILKRLVKRRSTRRRAALAKSAAITVQVDMTSDSTERPSDSVAPACSKERPLQVRASRTAVITSSSRIAFMFFIVTLVFYASWLPFFLCALDILQRDVIMENSHFVNSCTNFILYSVFNAKMRAEMVEKLRCGKRCRVSTAKS